jgi:NDP-sugar pyrophosphorylase family protein
VPEIDEVILSLNYQPRRIEDVFGDGRSVGLPIRYLVEPQPLGTGGAIKFAEPHLDGPVIVFNGDVLTQIDLNAVLALHRSRKAKATIVLTPVENPSAYGLVETAPDGAVQRFLEKPKPDEITTNHINAGIYILEPETFDRIPRDTPYSIERSYFPSLVERGETFVAYVYDGYWIDIGTPEKYTQVHRDIMSGAFSAIPFAGRRNAAIAEGARIEEGAVVEGPCFIDEGTVVRPGARVEPFSVVGKDCHVEEGAAVRGSIVWSGSWIGRDAVLDRAIVGRNAHVGRNAVVSPGRILGDKSVLTDFTQA